METVRVRSSRWPLKKLDKLNLQAAQTSQSPGLTSQCMQTFERNKGYVSSRRPLESFLERRDSVIQGGVSGEKTARLLITGGALNPAQRIDHDLRRVTDAAEQHKGVPVGGILLSSAMASGDQCSG